MPSLYASGEDILKTAAFPGEPTGHFIMPGAIERFTSSTVVVDPRHSSGQGTSITFYQLADGRGWIHDLDVYAPDTPSLTRGHFDDLNSPGKPAVWGNAADLFKHTNDYEQFHAAAHHYELRKPTIYSSSR